MKIDRTFCIAAFAVLTALWSGDPVQAQSVDRTRAPNVANEGIAKTLAQQIGADRGDWATPYSSSFIIARDPFRAIRRGRQLFQRKFSYAEGQGPLAGDGAGDLNANIALGAGLTDSCAACHGRPRGAAGSGGDVATRPGQPRRAAPVRPRPEGDAGRRDHRASFARSARAGRRAGARERTLRSASALVSQGHRATARSPRLPDGIRRHFARRRRRPRPARAAVLRPWRQVLDPRVRRRRAQRRDGPAGGRPRPRRGEGGRTRRDAVGHGARRRARSTRSAAGNAAPTRTRTTTASRTRSRRASSTISSSTCSTTSSRARTRHHRDDDARPRAVRSQRLQRVPRRRPYDLARPARGRRRDRVRPAARPVQPSVRDRRAAVRHRRRRQRLPAAQAAEARAVHRAQHLQRLQAPRPRTRTSTSATTTGRSGASSSPRRCGVSERRRRTGTTAAAST